MSRLRAGKAVLGIILGGAPTLSLALSEADCKEIMVQYGVVAAGCAPVATPVPTVLVPAAIPTAVSRSESQITDPATDRMRESHIFFLQGGSRLHGGLGG